MAINLDEEFAKYEHEYMEFDRIASKLNARPDLHAFLKLDDLVPGRVDMVCGTSHDEIWLSIQPDDLAAAATTDDICELIRCGLRYDEDMDSLCMFV